MSENISNGIQQQIQDMINQDLINDDLSINVLPKNASGKIPTKEELDYVTDLIIEFRQIQNKSRGMVYVSAPHIFSTGIGHCYKR